VRRGCEKGFCGEKERKKIWRKRRVEVDRWRFFELRRRYFEKGSIASSRLSSSSSSLVFVFVPALFILVVLFTMFLINSYSYSYSYS